MKRGRFEAYAALVVAGSTFGGCTHLEVNRFSGEGTEASRSGYAYMLDYTQYEVTVTRTLVACPAGEMPTIKVEANAVASLVPDGSQVYVINPDSLINAFKTSDIIVDYKDGRLVGFNATIEDKTADVIESVARTAGKIALLAGGIPVPVDGGTPAPTIGCSADAVAKLASKKSDTILLETATENLDKGKTLLTDLTTRYAARPTAALAMQIENQKVAVAAGQKNINALTGRITEINSWLSRSRSATWPETSSEFDSQPMLALDPATIDDWFDPVGLRVVIRETMARPRTRLDARTNTRRLMNDGDSGNARRLNLTLAQFTEKYPALVDSGFDPATCVAGVSTTSCRQFAEMKTALVPPEQLEARIAETRLHEVSFHLAPRGSYGSATDGGGSQDANAGLRYRVPAASWLYVCEGAAKCASPESRNSLVLRQAGSTAQLGKVFNLPFSSPAFASGGVSITFDDQGRLLKAGLKRTNSAALAAADATGSIVDQAVVYDRAARAEELTELNSAAAIAKARKDLADAEEALVESPAETLAEELAILEATREVEDARALVGPSRSKELQNEIDLAKLELDLAEQRKKLREDPNAGQAAIRAQYDAETAILNAQKSKLEAEAAVLEADKALREARATIPAPGS